MGKIIIEGITEDDRIFHPRNWIDRLSSLLGVFGSDHRLRYSPYVQPQVLNGTPCLVVDSELSETNSSCFQFLVDFAKSNRLRIREHNDPRLERTAYARN